MSGITLQLLHDTDPEAFAVAADNWGRMAQDLDNSLEELIGGTRDLE